MEQQYEPDQPVAAVSTAPPKKARSIGEMLRFLIIMIVVIFGIRLFMSPFEVEGRSMTPSLHDHDRVFVNRVSYLHLDINRVLNLLPGDDRDGTNDWFPFKGPDRGDVVVLNPPVESSQPFIKRVIGLPGETVTFDNGHVYVNGQVLDEPYLNGAETFCEGRRYCNFGPIPEGMVFVLGDNRGNSEDSRFFGPVSIADIIGKAWLTNWPIADVGLVPTNDYNLDQNAVEPTP